MLELTVSLADLDSLAAAVLGAGKGLCFRARGASMRPFVCDGDILDIQPVDARRIRRGDVVLCRSEQGRLLVHRVIRVARQEGQIVFLTRGDALVSYDSPVSQEQILGRLVAVKRAGKRRALHTHSQRLVGLLHAALLPLRVQMSRARRAFNARQLMHGPYT